MATQPPRRWQSQDSNPGCLFWARLCLISTYTSPVTHMIVNLNMFVNIRRLRKSKVEQWSGFGLTKWSSRDGRKEVLSRGPF